MIFFILLFFFGWGEGVLEVVLFTNNPILKKKNLRMGGGGGGRGGRGSRRGC